MKHEWFVELHGHSIDLERLARAFSAGRVAIAQEGDDYRLSDESLEESDDAEYVRGQLEGTIRRINALARIHFGEHEDVTPGNLGRPNETGGTDWFMYFHDSVRARASVTITHTGPDGKIIEPPNPLPGWVALADGDSDVDDVLHFLAHPSPDWMDLYKAFEVVRADVGKIQDRGWASGGELSRFTGTANHQGAAGRAARHARAKNSPVANPMSLDEARTLIRSIVQAWLTAKVA